MASNKNQHFVPRAHLRPFSVNNEGKAIHLFNLDRSESVFNAPVKNQCSRSYFYGRDPKLEKAIQFVEGHYAETVASLHRPCAVIDDRHTTILRRFTYLQHLRTEAAARRSAEMAFAISKEAELEQQTPKEAIKTAVITAMHNYTATMSIVDDLKVRIIRNRTSVPFVTSDDPAILTNRWHQQYPRARHRSFGIANAGAVLFLPLSPSLLAMFLDGDVYSCMHVGGWTDLFNPADVVACNQLQVLHCAANLYFGDPDADREVQTLASTFRHLRPANRYEIVLAVADGGTDTHTRYRVIQETEPRQGEDVLIHFKTISPVPKSWPTFLKLRRKRFVFTNDTGAGYSRRMTAVRSSWDSPPWRKVRG
jgi:hypothetical protein